MSNQKLLKYFFLFVAAFLLFSYFQHFPTFPDPDSFYHAKMAVLIRDQGIVKDFSWLEFTVLKNYYIDHHFLYHLLLVPFITFLDPLVGVKLATTLFAALSIVVFYWFLSASGGKVRGAFFYSLLLLITSPFIFRINLAKTSSISIIILLIGLHFIFNKRYWFLFLLSFIYIWTYGGWPLILILTILYILSDSLIKTIHYFSAQKFKIQNSKFKIFKFIENFYRAVFSKPNIKLCFSCFAGLVAGIIINPYFPKNLYFYWYQIIKIALINYQNKIGVGAEWYSYNFFDLISNASFVFILLVIAFSVFFVFIIKKIIKEDVSCDSQNLDKVLTLFLIFCFFFVLTIRSRRNVEYWVPFAILFSAFLINGYLPYKIEEILAKFKKFFSQKKFSTQVLSFCFLIVPPFIVGKDLISVKNNYQNGYPIDKYKGASEWLAKNTPAGSIVFHNDWDDFPSLFYYNTHNHYIAGLDPTFMYDYDKDLHKKWVDITTGKQDNISQIIKHKFHSDYVFVDKDHIFLENNLKRDGHFIMVYKDQEGKIYKLINTNNDGQ